MQELFEYLAEKTQVEEDFTPQMGAQLYDAFLMEVRMKVLCITWSIASSARVPH